jgi:hypothetical protein
LAGSSRSGECRSRALTVSRWHEPIRGAVGDVEDRAASGGVGEGGDAVHGLVARVGAAGEQILHDRRLAVGRREDQGCRSALHRRIHLRPGVEEQSRGGILPFVDGVDERRPAGEAAVAPVHVGPGLDEGAHGVDVSLARGRHEGGSARAVELVGIRSPREKRLHLERVPGSRGAGERRGRSVSACGESRQRDRTPQLPEMRRPHGPPSCCR